MTVSVYPTSPPFLFTLTYRPFFGTVVLDNGTPLHRGPHSITNSINFELTCFVIWEVVSLVKMSSGTLDWEHSRLQEGLRLKNTKELTEG